jgi:hypothetical protein
MAVLDVFREGRQGANAELCAHGMRSGAMGNSLFANFLETKYETTSLSAHRVQHQVSFRAGKNGVTAYGAVAVTVRSPK